MAEISPCVESLRRDAGLVRELQVLDHLRLALPEGFEVFHSIDWTSEHGGVDRHGEFDLVVLAPNANILIVEVKAGDVVLREGEVFKLGGFIRYTERLAEAGLELLVGSVGDSNDNALAKIRRESWRTRDEVEWPTLNWVGWFNNRRLLEPIGDIAPAEAERNYYSRLAESVVTA